VSQKQKEPPASPIASPGIVCDTIPATPVRRYRGKSLSRRIGQNGEVFLKTKCQRKLCNHNNRCPRYGRYWKDVPGQQARVRVVIPLGIVNRSVAIRSLRAHIESQGINSPETFQQNVSPATTFRQQAETWLAWIPKRERRKAKPATVLAYSNCVDNWLVPNLGELPLTAVGNKAVKELVAKMVRAGLSPKTINNYVQVVKLVVASARNDEGEPLHLRSWNHDFIDLPVVQNQNTPTLSGEEITTLVQSGRGMYRVLYALLAGSGLRIGEALGVEVKHLTGEVLQIRQRAWYGEILPGTKTENGNRDIDLHPDLSAMLKNYIGDRKSGLLFQTPSGKPLSQSNIQRASFKTLLTGLGRENVGFHAFRRFRVTHLREMAAPEDLLRFWIGHANKSITDNYSKLKTNLSLRKQWASKVGLGFDLPADSSVGQLGQPNEAEVKIAVAA